MNSASVGAYRNYKVTKANALIQKTRFSLTLQEQKIVLYVLTKIQPEDTDLTEYCFDIKEFCNICNIDADGMYTSLKETLKKLSDRSFWAVIDDRGTETLLRWIQKPYVLHRSGQVKIQLDEDMRPFLLELKKQFTTYSLIYILGMKSQYSIRIYELLKSYQSLGRWEFNVDELKHKLMCENYIQWNDFKRKVLDVAVKEINRCSDLLVSYELIKDGHRFSKIIFTIEPKKTMTQSLETMTNIEQAMNKKHSNTEEATPEGAPELNGQLDFF
jgi:plasmid replication initiation protein